MTHLDRLFDGLETPTTKQCGMCGEYRPLTQFGREGKGANGYLRYECRACASKHSKLIARIKRSAPPPGSDHVCPVCRRSAQELTTYGKRKTSVWVADHDHVTEQFRGWLCHKCNLGLGNLGDDPERCERAAAYLRGVV